MPAAKLFMKLTGSSSGLIKGEAKVANFKDQIELTDWKWSIARKGKDAQKAAEPSTFGFSKYMDRATTAMLGSMRNGEPMTAVIGMEEASREHFRLIITLEGVMIIGYDFATQINDSGGSIEESWSFDYDTVRFDYRSQAKDGMSTLILERPSDASTEAPSSPETKMIELARDMAPDKVERLWDRVKSEAGKNLSEKK
jgi:type VI secretion system Hcp family effector